MFALAIIAALAATGAQALTTKTIIMGANHYTTVVTIPSGANIAARSDGALQQSSLKTTTSTKTVDIALIPSGSTRVTITTTFPLTPTTTITSALGPTTTLGPTTIITKHRVVSPTPMTNSTATVTVPYPVTVGGPILVMPPWFNAAVQAAELDIKKVLVPLVLAAGAGALL